ncbi:MAG: AI-2E family transporter [Bacilli bacterium]|nr:AI-2E family transporter [Bacilli bacterium]
MKRTNYKLVNILLILLIVYVLFLLRGLWGNVFVKMLAILKPFIVAFAIAYAFYPLLKWLQKKKVPKTLAIIIIVTFMVLFLTLIIYSLIPIFTEQLISLFSSIMTFLSDISSRYDIDIEPIRNTLSDIFNKISYNIGKYISDGAVSLVNASISFISNFVIIFVCFIYFLIDMEKIRENVEFYFRKKGKKTFNLITKVDHETTQYFKGLSLTLIIQFFEYTIIYYLIGHPNFLLLGVLSSISTLIPYFGGFIVNVIALMIAYVISPKLFILTLIVALILPNVDGYIISPKIYGKTNNISPLLTIFAVFAGGVLGGFIGILIALPITIILRTIYNHYKNDISKKIGNIKEKI